MGCRSAADTRAVDGCDRGTSSWRNTPVLVSPEGEGLGEEEEEGEGAEGEEEEKVSPRSSRILSEQPLLRASGRSGPATR